VTILAILRHAKSDWGTPGLADFDRPLNERGRKAARRVGRELQRRKVRFDRVIASPALRVRETLDGLFEGHGEALDVRFDERIYDARPETLFHLVRTISENVHAPLIVGHNPGLHELVLKLAREDDDLRRKVAAKYPTAALALIALPAARWDAVEPGTGEIRELILPRELD
jgi:phosphohistidine phosphatase